MGRQRRPRRRCNGLRQRDLICPSRVQVAREQIKDVFSKRFRILTTQQLQHCAHRFQAQQASLQALNAGSDEAQPVLDTFRFKNEAKTPTTTILYSRHVQNIVTQLKAAGLFPGSKKDPATQGLKQGDTAVAMKLPTLSVKPNCDNDSAITPDSDSTTTETEAVPSPESSAPPTSARPIIEKANWMKDHNDLNAER
ncbi:hypothetical protein KEM48_014236 [Puccinia striiformis f. sp. tritici PST-130]|nr:hypothetical protein KEM48_014236 [Puccinia striiformis f. sp. tritici PST-130]